MSGPGTLILTTDSTVNASVDEFTINCSVYTTLVLHNNISVIEIPAHCRPTRYSLPVKILIALILGFVIFGTACGNLLVIAAVGMVKKLQTPNNLLIVSLAGSDFLVAVLVLPWALVTQLEGMWIFDSATCEMFIIFDVTLCTSSILNLCAISIDRYLVITRPFQYGVKRTPARMLWMIAITWIASALVTIPPYIGWKQKYIKGTCNYSDDLGYQIYATIGAFYLPLTVMLVLYGRIFRLAHRMAQADARQKMSTSLGALSQSGGSLSCVGISGGLGDNGGGLGRSSTAIDSAVDSEKDSLIVRLVRFKSSNNGGSSDDGVSSRRASDDKAIRITPNTLSIRGPNGSERSSSLVPPPRSASLTPADSNAGDYVVSMRRQHSNQSDHTQRRLSKRKNFRSNTETKAIRTLGVIMGCFTLCWLPFFIIQILVPIIKINKLDPHNYIPQVVFEFFLWLGYLNSFLNPIIYAKFNRDFRTPFKEILTCRCGNINARLRSESYAEQYGLPLRTVKRRMPRANNTRRKSSDLVVSVNRSGKVCSYLSNGTQASHA